MQSQNFKLDFSIDSNRNVYIKLSKYFSFYAIRQIKVFIKTTQRWEVYETKTLNIPLSGSF